MKKVKQQKKNIKKQSEQGNIKLAYAGFLYQTFFKRPFGYIIGLLFVIYLAIILVIVPAALHKAPLFIWNIAGFNMPIFNLFFIAGSTSCIAAAIFRTGRDDGTDLLLSSKPLTKKATIAIKTLVYLSIMLVFSLISLLIVSLIKPTFGTYDIITNSTGITDKEYKGLMLSMFTGNIVNMLFFGGIAILFSMVGGQVITIISTVAIAFLFNLLNFVYPITIKRPSSYLADTYGVELQSYSANTVGQALGKDENNDPYAYAAIDAGQQDFDVDKYWRIAKTKTQFDFTNYIDFGKQLSSLYNAFGLEDLLTEQASHLLIGSNTKYRYDTIKDTKVLEKARDESLDYPMIFYDVHSSQGVFYPTINIIGGDRNISTNGWVAASMFNNLDFDSITVLSRNDRSIDAGGWINSVIHQYDKGWFKLSDIQVNDHENAFSIAKEVYDRLTIWIASRVKNEKDFSQQLPYVINEYFRVISGKFENNPFYSGEFEKLDKDGGIHNKYLATSKFHLILALYAQYCQIVDIEEYFKSKDLNVTFPFTSDQVMEWYKNRVLDDETMKLGDYFVRHNLTKLIFQNGIYVDDVEDKTTHEKIHCFDVLVHSQFNYCETYNNMYKYKIRNFYSPTSLIVVWSILALTLFSTAIVIYRRTDFK